LQGEREFLENLLSEYRRGLETRAGAAEADFLRGRLPDDHPELEDLAAVDKFFAGSLDWQRRRRQGYVWSGGVLDETGRERVGVLAVLGPLSYFAGQEGEAGMLIGRSNQFLPGLLTFKSPAEIEALRAFIAGSEAQVPVDVSLGDAVKLREARLSPGERLRQGGMVMVPLLGIGVLALVLSVLKLWDLHRLRVRLEPSQLEWFREKEESRMAAQLQEAEQVPQAVGPLLTAALRHRRASREHLEEILHEQVLAALPRLERSLGALAVFGGIAPLLGLLGTVTGMIHTFQMVTLFGTGNARTLSGGISEALVTTAAGLIIAIPVLLVHAFLARRAKLKLAELEQTAVLLVNLLKSDAPEADGCRP
jgi:biopolymer transport protein ExbB